MRKSALTSRSNKVYTPHSLEIAGDKIVLTEPQIRNKSKKVFTKKTLKIDPPEETTLYSVQKPCQLHAYPPKPVKNTYDTVKTPFTEYKNSDLSNKVLRQIRETTKVDDFERILRGNQFLACKGAYITKNKPDRVLDTLLEEDLYEQFFGQHFEYLESLIVNQKKSPNQD